MTTHTLAITYKPKEEAVRNGICRQTIRPVSESPRAKPRRIGDGLLLHGWAGTPYYSKWSWRRQERLTEAINILVSKDGFNVNGHHDVFHTWDSPWADALASFDFIDPPTGLELFKVLTHFHKIETPKPMQILRW